ncbi:MAG: penicillin-binding protein 2 [Burkholderiaceae bacterium]|nr:MAG: penicillin-binding protein 2 [Burkholderiaceae bacterium]
MAAPTGARALPFAHNPLLTLSLKPWRSRLVFVLLALLFFALLGRAFQLQALSTDFLQKQGESRYARTLELPATRGKITDRHGAVLATSLPVKTLWAIPEDVQADAGQLTRLAQLLELPVTELRKKLADEDRGFVYLKRQVTDEVAEQVKALKIGGIYERREYKRFYPEAESTVQLLGLTNIDGNGLDGLEFALNQDLAGKSGTRRVIKDRLGNIVDDLGAARPPHDGNDIALALDARLQYLAYAKLKEGILAHHAKAGAAVVLDARTGEILALANLPSFNPNDRDQFSSAALRDRAVANSYELGSVMKPLVLGLALDQQLVKPTTVIETAPGKLSIGPATINDAHVHGALTVEEVLQKSSNVGAAKIALRMSPQTMWELFTQVGFGQAPNVDLPGAVAGRVRPYKSWRPIEQATMAYGHGISVSLLQMARAYTVFTNDGVLLPLQLQRQPESTMPVGTRVFSAATAQAMRKMMEMVVSPEGTAPKAQIVGYRVGGKTGTAHKLGGHGYEDRYVVSFIGFAPASDPRLIIAVMIDEPSGAQYYAGDVAAPVFAEIAGGAMRALQISPDAPFKTLVVPSATIEERT